MCCIVVTIRIVREFCVWQASYNQYHLFLCVQLFFLICCCFTREKARESESERHDAIRSISAALFTKCTTLFYYLTKRLIAFFTAIPDRTALELSFFFFQKKRGKNGRLKARLVLFSFSVSLVSYILFFFILNFVHAFSDLILHFSL